MKKERKNFFALKFYKAKVRKMIRMSQNVIKKIILQRVKFIY